MRDLSIIIQGPLNPILLKSIPNYLRFGNVILSTCYERNDDEYQLIDDLLRCKYSNFTIVQQHVEEYDLFNAHNVYRQAITTLEGLYFTKTQYAIKVRTDEFFENLLPVIDKLKSDHVVCSDFFYYGGFPYQISDHIIGMLTKDMKDTFSLVKTLCRCVPPHSDLTIPDGKWFGLNFNPVTEALIFSSYLRTKRILPLLANSYFYRKLYSCPVNSNLLGEYYARANCKNLYYTDQHPEGISLCT